MTMGRKSSLTGHATPSGEMKCQITHERQILATSYLTRCDAHSLPRCKLCGRRRKGLHLPGRLPVAAVSKNGHLDCGVDPRMDIWTVGVLSRRLLTAKETYADSTR
jgi:hypothetical protein